MHGLKKEGNPEDMQILQYGYVATFHNHDTVDFNVLWKTAFTVLKINYGN